MRALNFFIGYACAFFFMAGIVISCDSGGKHNDKPHTPLYVYFNPLQLDMSMETLMPYFVNYPTDWAKMGLRDYPMTVTYEYSYPAWGVTGSSQYAFLSNGRLSEQRRTSFNVGATGFDVVSFEYDSNSSLVKIKSVEDGRYKHRYNDNGFIYDAAGRLTRRERDRGGNPGTWDYLYEYHENGALKSIRPEKENSLANEAGVTLYKIQIDSLGRIEKIENVKPTNIFLKDISEYKREKSVTVFSYTDNLCTQAVEKIPVKFDQGTETLTCTSTFTYNSHGDLATWTYSGGVYKNKGNSWRVDDMTFTVTYEYVYDEKGNWTQAKIIFPSNLDEIPALRTYYKATKDGFTSNQDRSSSTKNGEAPFLTANRTISYYDEDMMKNETSASGNKEKQSVEELLYKGTDTYGLLGKVKSVTEEHECLKFDQSGNLVYQKNSFDKETTYTYLTPTSYNVSGWGEAVVNIAIKDGLRSDTDSDTNTELNHEYTFDSSQRLIKHVFCSQMAMVTCTYQYKGNDKYPSTMIEEHPEEGVTTYHYTYTQFDKKNNWTERKVSYATEYDDYDDDMNYIGKKQTWPEEYIEKRTIEYW